MERGLPPALNLPAPDPASQALKNWLRKRIEEVELTRSGAIECIQEKLNAIVSESLETGSNVLDYENSSLEEITAAGNHLYHCNNNILRVLLAVCSIFDSQENGFQQDRHLLLRPQLQNSVIQIHASRNDYIQLASVNQPCVNAITSSKSRSKHSQIDDRVPEHSSKYNSPGVTDNTPASSSVVVLDECIPAGDDLLVTVPTPGPEVAVPETERANDGDIGCPNKVRLSSSEVAQVETPQKSLNDSLGPLSETGYCAYRTRSQTEGSSDTLIYNSSDTSSLSLDSIATGGLHQEASDISMNVKIDMDGFLGTVSDVVSPHSFNITKKSDLPALEKLGDDLIKFYHNTKSVDKKLVFLVAPKPGEFCAALYLPDKNWYRGRVLHATGPSTVVVEYIDYGNTDEILWRHAFKLPKKFCGIPRMSIRCCLAGVKPSEKSGSQGKKWTDDAEKWFDQAVYGATFNVIPIFYSSEMLYVQIFTAVEGKTTSICISDLLVELGLADYDAREDDTVEILPLSERDELVTRNSPSDASVKMPEISCIGENTCEVPKNTSSQADCQGTCPAVSINEPQLGKNQIKEKCDTMVDNLANWDPMSEDFRSIYNSYGVDNEDACTMIEGFDPTKHPVCPYFLTKKGCWNGDRCPKLHPEPTKSGEYKQKVPTFSCSQIESLRLIEGNLYVISITSIDHMKNFFVHVIKPLKDVELFKMKYDRSKEQFSKDLTELSLDMAAHCNHGARRINNLIQPAVGEAYIVYVREMDSFCRGMILEVHGVRSASQTVEVHLIDLGSVVFVNIGFLYSMSQAFMHLPKQAVQCMLHEGQDVDYKRLSKLVSNKKSVTLIMKVIQICENVDGPLQVTLHRLSSNGLKLF